MANNRNNQGTGFVNYDDILNANQTSGKRMGQAVAGGLQSQAQSVNQSLQDQQNEFNQGIQNSQNEWSNTSALADQLANYGTSGNWDAVANASTDANGNPVDFGAAGNNFRNYNYNGPTGLKNASGLQTQAQSASEAGRLAGSAQGQQQLLGQYVGGQNYNQGQSQFDQALLNKYGRGDINQARRGLTGLAQQANNAVSGAQSAATNQANLISAQKEDNLKKINNSLYGGTATGGSGTSGGILSLGEQNKANEVSDIQRIRDLITPGKIDPSKYTDADKALLAGMGNRFQNYGVDTARQYYYTPDKNDDMQRALLGVRNIATDFNVNGNYLLDGNERKAADNLAGFANANIPASAFADLSKTYTGNLGNTIATTTDISKENQTGVNNEHAGNRDYWNQAQQVLGTFDNKNDAIARLARAALLKSDYGRQANARSIAQGYGSIYDNPQVAAQIQGKQRAEESKLADGQAHYNYGTGKNLLDFLNRYDVTKQQETSI